VLSEVVEGASALKQVAAANIASIKEDFVVTDLQETDAQLGGVAAEKQIFLFSQAGLRRSCNSPDCQEGQPQLSMASLTARIIRPYPRRSFAEENG